MHYDAVMRTTVDLPEDLHKVLASLATHTRRTLSATAVELMRRGLEQGAGVADGRRQAVRLDQATGLPVVSLRRPVTPEDVKALEDEA
jgi:predicted transcriptional regulator